MSPAYLDSSVAAAHSILQTAGAPTATVPTFTTECYFTAQAADATSAWLATYTIQEVCTGDRAAWTPPVPPPDFTTTVVTCPGACAAPAQTVTCPADPADRRAGGLAGAAATPSPVAMPGGPGVEREREREQARELEAEPSGTEAEVWWGGALLTQSISRDPSSRAPTDRVQTGDAASTWGNLALLSGALTVAVGWALMK